MSRLAVYADPDSEPFRVRKPWDELTPDEWAAIFERGIRDDDSLAAPVAVLERSGRTEGGALRSFLDAQADQSGAALIGCGPHRVNVTCFKGNGGELAFSGLRDADSYEMAL